MNGRKRPSPALVVAVLALFVSLSGTAVAAGVVPLAKRALSADNAKKLEGQTAAAIASLINRVADVIAEFHDVGTCPSALSRRVTAGPAAASLTTAN